MSSRSGNGNSGWILVAALAIVAMVSSLALLMAGFEYVGNRVTTPPSELKSSQDVMDTAVDVYEDAILGCFAAVPGKSHQFYFDTEMDGGMGTGEPGDGASTIVVDQLDILKGMRCNVIVMGVAYPDGTFTACAAWEIRSDNPQARMIQPENCVP